MAGRHGTWTPKVPLTEIVEHRPAEDVAAVEL